MQSDDSLAFLCRGICVELGPSLSAALRPTVIEEGPLPPCSPTTWLAKGCRLVTLIQTERGTRVYDQKEDFLYYASEAGQLGPERPPGRAFLGQTVLDRDRAGYPPNVHSIYKLFFLCTITGGQPTPSIESSHIEFFPVHALPDLDLQRVRQEDILHAFRMFKGETAEIQLN